jgi:hypothetical protein
LGVLEPSKNLFDNTTISTGKGLNQNNGSLYNDANSFTTDYITITDSTNYYIWGMHNQIVYYNASKVFISGSAPGNATERAIASPANSTYLKITFANTFQNVTQLDIAQVELGEVFTGYESFGLKFKNYFKPKNTIGYSLENNPVLVSELLTSSDNLFDRTNYLFGSVNTSTGALTTSYTYYVSNYIPVSDSTWYALKNVEMYGWYNSSKVFISGANIASNADNFLYAPTNAAYVRVSAANLNMMLYASENKVKSLQNSKYTIDENYAASKITSLNDFIDLYSIIPDTLFVVKGHEFSFYLDNYIFANFPLKFYDLNFSSTLSTLKIYSSDTYSPAGDLGYYLRLDSSTTAGLTDGNYPVTLNMYLYDKLAFTLRTNIKVIGSTWGSGITRKVLFVGESTTNAGVYLEELERMGSIDNYHITTVGGRTTGTTSHEGVDGWTFQNHATHASSNFVSGGVINIQNFEATYSTGIDTGDWIIFLGHINEAYATTGITYISKLIDSMKVVYPDARFGVCYPIPPWGKDAVSYQGLSNYRRNYNYSMLCRTLQSTYGNREDENIHLISLHSFDRFNGYSTADNPLNWRMKTTTRKVAYNVHPSNSGYYLISDALFEFLKGKR